MRRPIVRKRFIGALSAISVASFVLLSGSVAAETDEMPAHAHIVDSASLKVRQPPLEDTRRRLDSLRKLADSRPDDWKVWERIVQCCQAVGNATELEKARDRLFDLFAKGRVDAPMFCRDLFTESNKVILAFEVFKPKPPMGVLYEFVVFDAPRHVQYRFTFGELDTDTKIGREMGKLADDEHRYSIDRFDRDNVQTLVTMMKGTSPPAYERIKSIVEDNLSRTVSTEVSK